METPNNGTWIQEVAYLLESIQVLINSNITSGQTTEVTIDNIINLPPKHVTVVEYESFPKPPAKVMQTVTVVPREVIEHKITITMAERRCCGHITRNDWRYSICTEKVAEAVANDVEWKDLTYTNIAKQEIERREAIRKNNYKRTRRNGGR